MSALQNSVHQVQDRIGEKPNFLVRIFFVKTEGSFNSKWFLITTYVKVKWA